MASFAQFGNDLHTGKLSYDFVGKTKIWYSIAVAMILIAIFVPMLRGGFVFGIEFRGGSQFEISQANNLDTKVAQDSVLAVADGVDPRVTIVGESAGGASVCTLLGGFRDRLPIIAIRPARTTRGSRSPSR